MGNGKKKGGLGWGMVMWIGHVRLMGMVRIIDTSNFVGYPNLRFYLIFQKKSLISRTAYGFSGDQAAG
jgi:hypothetical protein